MFDFIKQLWADIFHGGVIPLTKQEKEAYARRDEREAKETERLVRQAEVAKLEEDYAQMLLTLDEQAWRDTPYLPYTSLICGFPMPNYARIWEAESYRRDEIEQEYRVGLMTMPDTDLIKLAEETSSNSRGDFRTEKIREELGYRVNFRRDLEYAKEMNLAQGVFDDRN